MIFEQIPANGDRNLAYLIGEEMSGNAAVIDPSYGPERALAAAASHGLTVRYVISTHSHPDHVAGNSYVLEHSETAIEVMHESTPHSCGLRVRDGEALALGNLQLRFLHTPGHVPDHMCILTEEKLLTGDILFVGKIGGTGPSFPGSDPRQQWESLHRLMKLGSAVEVWPGHDYGVTPSSTIGRESSSNPFLLCKSFEEFIYLKEHWAEYKKEHNIV